MIIEPILKNLYIRIFAQANMDSILSAVLVIPLAALTFRRGIIGVEALLNRCADPCANES